MRFFQSIAIASLAALLAACGGGGGGSNDTSNENTNNTGPSGSNPDPATPSFKVDATARFHEPSAITVDSAGNIYVLDSGNQALRKIATSGSVSTVSGTYAAESDLVADQSGNIFVYTSPEMYKVAANGVRTLQFTLPNGPDTPGSIAPHGFSIDDSGTFYTLNKGFRQNIFSIDQTGEWKYVYTGGQLILEHAVASDAQGNLAMAINPEKPDLKRGLVLIPKSAQTGHLRSLEGLPTVEVNHSGHVDDMAYDANGNLYIADSYDEGADAVITIMRMTPELSITTLLTWRSDRSNGATADRRVGIAVGNDGIVYFTDPANHAVYKLDASSQPIPIAGKLGEAGNSD